VTLIGVWGAFVLDHQRFLWRHPQNADLVRGDGAAIEVVGEGLSKFDSVEEMGAKK